MIRRFNYTKRQKILSQEFTIMVIEKEEAPPSVRLSLEETTLKNYPANAEILLEAYRGCRPYTINFGSPAKFIMNQQKLLPKETVPEKLLFRLKIVDLESDQRKLLGWAQQIRPVTNDKKGNPRKSILSVVSESLGNVIWDLDFSVDPTQPVLKVNSQISTEREITSIVEHDSDFRCLVLPVVFKRILENLFKDEDWESTIPEENDWLLFSKHLNGNPPDDQEEIQNWIHATVDIFAERINTIPNYKEYKGSKK